jgi:hypothetical protein
MSDNDITLVRDWDFDVNLSGLVAPTGKGGNVLPTGYYKVKLSDLYVNPDRNINRVIIKLTVAEGPFTGAIRTTGFNKPNGPNDKVRYYWRGLAESAGYTPAQLDSGSLKLGLATFKDRDAYIFFQEKDEDAGRQYEDIDFLPPMEWSQQKQNFDLQQAALAQQAVASKAAAGSALSAAPVIEKPKANLSNNSTSASKLASLLG